MFLAEKLIANTNNKHIAKVKLAVNKNIFLASEMSS